MIGDEAISIDFTDYFIFSGNECPASYSVESELPLWIQDTSTELQSSNKELKGLWEIAITAVVAT
jgi:hypothetical protein